MKEFDPTSVVSDAQLVQDVRQGSRYAMADLYGRHSADAFQLASLLTKNHDPDELVAEAFIRVFDKIVHGFGPTDSFRSYLHAVVRNLHHERHRQRAREQASSDKEWLLDSVIELDNGATDLVETERAVRALRALPENWRQLLWELNVQGRKPADVAADLGIKASTLSATAYRAREGLRLAYLDELIPKTSAARCAWTRHRLSRLTRGRLTPRAQQTAQRHLETCADCRAAYEHLRQVNTKFDAPETMYLASPTEDSA